MSELYCYRIMNKQFIKTYGRRIHLLLPIELTNGNEGRTKFWANAAKVREEYAETLRVLGIRCPKTPFYRQTVTVVRILTTKQMLWDPSSCLRGNYKEIEDTLTQFGWWHGDSPKWLEWVRPAQDRTRPQLGGHTEIIINEYLPEVSAAEQINAEIEAIARLVEGGTDIGKSLKETGAVLAESIRRRKREVL